MGGEQSMAAEAGTVETEAALGWSEANRPSEDAGAKPLLERAEMAALLGGARTGKPALPAMAGSAPAAYERLPMLEVVFDQLQRLLIASLRDLAAGGIDLSPEAIAARRFGEYLESLPRPLPIAVVRAVEWNGSALLTVDQGLARALVDLWLGGRRGAPVSAAEPRPLTTIELALVERFARLVLADLARAFAPVTEVRFVLERIETDPRFVAFGRPRDLCVLLRLGVGLDGRGGALEFAIPYATLEPVRALLRAPFPGERFGSDPLWERHLAEQIWLAEVAIEAALDIPNVTLRELLELQPGAVLTLSTRPDASVVLRCSGVAMLAGKLGRVGDRVSVRIEEQLGRAWEP